MANLQLSLAIGEYDHVRDVLDVRGERVAAMPTVR